MKQVLLNVTIVLLVKIKQLKEKIIVNLVQLGLVVVCQYYTDRWMEYKLYTVY